MVQKKGDFEISNTETKTSLKQGSLNYPFCFGGIKQCKFMVILRDFLYNNALFGLVIEQPLSN